ncbi:hypothetical protein BBP40_002129 [Aspergillus hancockii]|nr:hypothetical protein BBP40_002129 [Aspergillus hancockii]
MAAQAPWRTLFQSHLTDNSSTSFTLSTVSHDAENKPVPRSRTCEFRGFWPAPKLHESAVKALEDQGVGQNPAVYESDMLSLTTDIRMEKVRELASSGNVIEGMFWLADVGNQWRVRGQAFVIGDPKGGKLEERARGEIERGMRESGDVSEWSWEREVTTYFANHSPAMRGSFRNPPPGTPRSQGPADPALELNQKVEDLQDPVARRNFRVVVIRPEEVERLDLSDLQNVRRVKWTFVQAGNKDGKGEWVETELWP